MIRTLPQILAQIRQDDPNTSITYYALRNMCVKNEVPYCRVGNRYLVDMDVSRPIFTSINACFCGCTDKI